MSDMTNQQLFINFGIRGEPYSYHNMAIEYIEHRINTDDHNRIFYDIYNHYDKYDFINREYCKNYLLVIFNELFDRTIDLQLVSRMNELGETVRRKEHENFRQQVVRRDGCCVISGVHMDSCEAAHIYDLQYEPLNYDPNNGILLGATLHLEFDRLKWCVDPATYQIVISEKYRVQNLEIKKYTYKDLRLKLSDHPLMRDYLKKKFQKFTDDQQ